MFWDQIDALNACIEAVPTDGLGITNSDLDQLGAKSYTEVDNILIEYINLMNSYDSDNYDEDERRLKKLEKHPVIKRRHRTDFKRETHITFPETNSLISSLRSLSGNENN